MGAVELATAYVALTVETRNVAKEVQQGFDPVEKIADRTGTKAGKGFLKGLKPSMAGVAGLFSGAMAGLAVKNFLGDALAEARESQKVGALTTSIIKSTGGAAKITEEQVGALADTLSRKTGIDDEQVQAGSNLLLTFKNVRNEVGAGNDMFNKATAAALDLSKAGFGSVEGASKMLGKALNDPIKGIAALGRAGVTFSAAQKEQIKVMVESGDVLGAQKIIMAEVESQVGGAAAATATAGDKARVVFDNLKESAGRQLLPMIDKLAVGFTTLVGEFQKGEGTGGRIRVIFTTIKDAVAGLVQEFREGTGVGGGFRTIVDGLVGVVKFFADHTTLAKVAIGGIVTGMIAWKAATIGMNAVAAIQLLLLKAHTVGTIQHTIVSKAAQAATKLWAAGQWLLNAALTANPIGIVIVVIAALVAAVILAYKKNETFREIVQKAWAAVKTAISAVVLWFKDVAWPWLRNAIQWISEKFTALKTKVVWEWNDMKNKLSTGYTWIKTNVFDPFKAAIGLVQKKFEDVKKGIGVAWDALKAIAKAPVKFIINTVLNDGLIGGFNWLSSKIGGPSIGRIPLPRGFKTGGVTPGFTPGRDVHRFFSPTGGTLDLSGGEGILVPTITRALGGLKGINALNRGDFSPLQHLGGFAGGGVLGWITGKAKGAFDWMLDKASALYQAAANPTKFIQDRLSGMLNRIPGGAAMKDAGKATVSKGIGAVVSKLQGLWGAFKSAFAQSEDTGGGTAGGSGMGWRAQVAWARKNVPWSAITSTVRTGNPASDHDKGRAIDLAGGSMSRTFEAIRDYFNVKAVRSLYYTPKGSRQIRFGQYSNTPPHIANTHSDHVHWAMKEGGVWPKPKVFDRGGFIGPGLNVLDNRTGGTEELRPVGRAGGYNVRDINVTVALEQLADVETLRDFLELLDRPVQIKVASGRVDG